MATSRSPAYNARETAIGTRESVADPCHPSDQLDAVGASFASDYLRSLSVGAVPTTLRSRFGDSDLVQETLLAALRSVEQFRGTTPHCLRAWLSEIFRNRLKNLVRDHLTCQKRSVHRECSLPNDDELECDSSVNPLKIHFEVGEDELRVMEQTFNQLSISDQQIVEQHSRAGLTIDEIATMLGVSPEAARKRYSRAINRWRMLVERALNELK